MISGTKEWAVAEINCCVGCPHNCRYCYARAAAFKNGLIDSAEQWTRMRCSDRSVPANAQRYGGQVMFPAAHDIVAENLELSIAVIDRLLAAGNRVLIVSKPDVYCIEQLCDQFNHQRSQLLFRFTITARDPAVVSFWEPNAPGYEDRLKSLKLAFARGFETSVSCEPILDIEDCIQMVEEIEAFVSHSIWLGKMRRIEERVLVDSDAAAAEVARIVSQQSDARIRLLYESLKGKLLIRWKESIKLVVGLPPATESGLDI
jgi:DNA repair photolyase